MRFGSAPAFSKAFTIAALGHRPPTPAIRGVRPLANVQFGSMRQPRRSVTRRESAARTQCTNNMKQIALAIHAFQGANKKLPPAGRGYGWCQVTGNYRGDALITNENGLVSLLPYLEQNSLYIKFNRAQAYANT